MIRVVVVDDHPALRAGLHTVLESEPGIVYAGESGGEEESVWPLLRRVEPDIVLLDYHLPKGDGLQLCYRIKQCDPAPRVLLYSAYANPTLALPARLARADGLVDKGTGAHDLFEAIRLVNGGKLLLPPISRTVLEEAYEKIDEQQRPLMGMLLDGCPEQEAAQTLGMEVSDVRHAAQEMLSRLRLDIPAAREA
jgi:DNA-binding NarL/FixJ family response regulator